MNTENIRGAHTHVRQLTEDIQQCRGELAVALMNLNRACQCSCLQREPARLDDALKALDLIASRQRAAVVIAAVEAVRWPAPYGESPYHDVVTVLKQSLAGHALPSGSTGAMRELHQHCIARFSPPAARARWDLDDEGRRRRYPRLLRAMINGALLTPGEADAALRVLLRTHPEGRRHSSPAAEALSHFGGNLAAVRAAKRWRRIFASTKGAVRSPAAHEMEALPA